MSDPSNCYCCQGGHMQFTVFKGSAYNSLTRGFVERVFNDERAQAIIQFFNDTFAPEENVWASINGLPDGIPGGYPVTVRQTEDTVASRVVVWIGDDYKCKGEYIRAVCVFVQDDLPWLYQRPQLWVNKVMEEVDDRVLDCLEAKLFERASSKIVYVDNGYFSNLPHSRYYRDLPRGVEMK